MNGLLDLVGEGDAHGVDDEIPPGRTLINLPVSSLVVAGYADLHRPNKRYVPQDIDPLSAGGAVTASLAAQHGRAFSGWGRYGTVLRHHPIELNPVRTFTSLDAANALRR